MNLLDKAADWIREALAFLPPRFVTFVWFPLLVTVVFVAAMLFIRRLLPLIGRLGAAVLRFLASLVAAVLLAPDMIIATVCRHVHRYPPAVLYHYGDAVATALIEVARMNSAVANALARVARINVIFVILGCAAVIWTWNQGHCPTVPAATTCVRPFTSWVDNIGDDHPAPPEPLAPKTSPNRNSTPNRK